MFKPFTGEVRFFWSSDVHYLESMAAFRIDAILGNSCRGQKEGDVEDLSDFKQTKRQCVTEGG